MGSEIVVTIRSRDTTDDGSSVVVVSPPESETGQKGKVSTESKNGMFAWCFLIDRYSNLC